MIRTVVVTTIDHLHGEYDILGLVHTTIVTSKSLVGDLVANVKNWTVGGELPGYTDMIDAAVETAKNRLADRAREMEADAVIGFRLCSTEVSEGAAEIIAYGTAIKRKT
jgi:uncharacterized protein YbjQ (UPF0145 family)